jgi:molecular chaperone Hsp33
VNGEVPETGFDRILRFTLPDRHARGRVVRLGPVLDEILSAHAYPAPIRHLLAEALALTALLGSLLKDGDGQLTMQAQTQSGAVRLLACDYRGGELRGYVQHDAAMVAALGANPSISRRPDSVIRESSRSKAAPWPRLARAISPSRSKSRR